MAKITLKEGHNPYPNPQICECCIHYVDMADDWSAPNYGCNNHSPRGQRISNTECYGFSPEDGVEERYAVNNDTEYSGISDNRLHNILGVARKAYQIAKDRGHDEKFARKMFMIGWLHDIGYEFSERQEYHPFESGEMMKLLFDAPQRKIHMSTGWDMELIYDYYTSPSYKAIVEHGKCPREKKVVEHGKCSREMTEEYIILSQANMLIDFDGMEVNVMTRLDGIKNRYGEHSDQYLTACDICYQIGLTPVNIAGNLTHSTHI